MAQYSSRCPSQDAPSSGLNECAHWLSNLVEGIFWEAAGYGVRLVGNLELEGGTVSWLIFCFSGRIRIAQ